MSDKQDLNNPIILIGNDDEVTSSQLQLILEMFFHNQEKDILFTTDPRTAFHFIRKEHSRIELCIFDINGFLETENFCLFSQLKRAKISIPPYMITSAYGTKHIQENYPDCVSSMSVPFEVEDFLREVSTALKGQRFKPA